MRAAELDASPTMKSLSSSFMNSVHMFTLPTNAHAQADVNARSDDGESPLHCCAFGGHADLCRILLRGGAMVDALALRDGDTPLHLAALGRHVSVIEVCLHDVSFFL